MAFRYRDNTTLLAFCHNSIKSRTLSLHYPHVSPIQYCTVTRSFALLFHSFIPSFTHSLSRSFIHPLNLSLARSLAHSFIPSLARSFIHSFIPSLARSIAHSFIHSLTQKPQLVARERSQGYRADTPSVCTVN